MTAEPLAPPPFLAERRLTSAYLVVALVALAVGGLMGLFQAITYAGFDRLIGFNPYLDLPWIASYYQGLTIHGVLLILVWTTFFICGFLTLVLVQVLRQPLVSLRLGWAAFGIMLFGLVLALLPILANDATVLFTFYPPLKANVLYYLGLTLLVVGTWVVLLTFIRTYRAWRREHPAERTPLAAFMALVTMTMWTIASLGVAAEILFLVLPWSLGLVSGVDPLLARTLFWFTGHPIVYFWLLPAYLSWYTMVPQQAGGRLFSDPMARVSFLLFLLLSIPVGIHHQYADPGIHQGMKLLQAIFTFGVFFPSLLTFFNVVASLELAGRARGGRGWLGWIPSLPWNDPVVTAQLLAMILFAFGGIGGLVNASYNVNLVVHNTSFVVGHFHLTVGTAVTLTFMGILYWLVPYLSGRALVGRRWALAQAWLWFIGMALFSLALHRLGLLGMPRRTNIGDAPYLPLQPEWQSWLPLVGIGGVIMTLSGLIFFAVLLLTLLRSRQPAQVVFPEASALSGPADAPVLLDRWRPWLALSAVLIVVAYGPPLATQLATLALTSPGLRPW
jgi:cytochrome c oxidase subunit 1